MGCNCGKANARLYYLVCPNCKSVKPKKGRKEELIKTEKCFNCGHSPINVKRTINDRFRNPKRK